MGRDFIPGALAMVKKTTKATNEVDADKPMRTSVIKKQIRRTLSTAQFETLVIEDGFEEIIEWRTISERDKKIDNWDVILLQRFKKSHDKILDELGLSHKKAYFKNPSLETKAKYLKQKKLSDQPESVRGLNLDDLDILESE